MLKLPFPFISLMLLPVLLAAQPKRLTIEDASGLNPNLIPASLAQLQWRTGANRYVFVANNNLVQGSPGIARRDTLVRLSWLNRILQTEKHDTLKKFPQFTFMTEDRFSFIHASGFYIYDLMKNSLERVSAWPEKVENVDVSADGKKVAYTKQNNLFISEGGKETAVTDEKNPGILYGSNRVHRNEFGISKGTFWSPAGDRLAFYRMDETMVTDYPLVDVTQRIAALTPVKYPMAGMTSHEVTVGVYSPASGTTVYLQTGQSFRDSASSTGYLTNVTWSPDGKSIYIATLNRDQNYMLMNQYDVSTGWFVKTLFKEQDDRYVEPQEGPEFLKGDPGKFIWESRRDGYNHLYLYDTTGNMIRQLTAGEWEVTEYLQSDRAASRAWFLCNKDNPTGRQLYVVDLQGSGMNAITSVPGTHSARISDDGRFILDTYSSATVPRLSVVLDPAGKPVDTLLVADNPVKDYQLGETTLFTVKNVEGADLHCRLIRPATFDPGKQYPAIIYVYGGPHSQLVTNSWLGGGGLFLNYLADQGYVVFTLDNRGTSYRGRDFEQAIFRNLGIKEVEDQMVGVQALKSMSFVDSTRIGINGWSYGGFLTISMFLKYPGVFRTAVCGGPVIDWKYYEVMYGERYMDTPSSNPEGYRNACLLNYVKDLKGKLLIIHDYQDETVVPQNSLVFLKKCVDERKQVDFFVYPGHEHNVRGKDRAHLNQKMVQYFLENL